MPWEEKLLAGPIGDYLEVIDVDPASGNFYEPVELDTPHLLAEDGWRPSEGNPQFHQQMVYAVAMTTIRNFERALGRRVLWSPRRFDSEDRERRERFVRRLRIYPHALREPNAYYSPAKSALLFGYFPASSTNPGRNLPGGTIFTCLSHDIVAHETTHAILDGLHRRYIEASNPDALAFHEGMSDIVALFQHFTFPEAVRHQIARMRGDLGQRSLLSELALQFGEAIGHYGALRSAIDQKDPASGEPDAGLLSATPEPHQRGAILVAAVFDAFVAIYKASTADLLRLSTGDGSRFPDQDLHPDLVTRLTAEANKVAGHVLKMCIRALDYLPPVDVTFGDFLRALITADADLVPDDVRNYRIAMVEAFRRRGIYPAECRSLAVDSLLWEGPRKDLDVDFLSSLDVRYCEDREQVWRQAQSNQKLAWKWLDRLTTDKDIRGQGRALGLWLTEDAPASIRRSKWKTGLPSVEIHSVRLARRVSPDGEQLPQVVIEITQARRGYAKEADQARHDKTKQPVPGAAGFTFRGGCTLIADLRSRKIRYAIVKDIDSRKRLEDQRRFTFASGESSLGATYFGIKNRKEPLAFLHRNCC